MPDSLNVSTYSAKPEPDYCSAEMWCQDNRECTEERTAMRAENERLKAEVLRLHRERDEAREDARRFRKGLGYD